MLGEFTERRPDSYQVVAGDETSASPWQGQEPDCVAMISNVYSV
jgi:hypothetical protein